MKGTLISSFVRAKKIRKK